MSYYGGSSSTGWERSVTVISEHIGLEALQKEEGVLFEGARAVDACGRGGWGQRKMGGATEGRCARVPREVVRERGGWGSSLHFF
jgi:hypothetical protein